MRKLLSSLKFSKNLPTSDVVGYSTHNCSFERLQRFFVQFVIYLIEFICLKWSEHQKEPLRRRVS